jgi:hypothetical protein
VATVATAARAARAAAALAAPSIGVMLLADSTVVGANAESMALGSGGFGGSSLAAGHGGGQGKRAYVLQG